MLVFIQKSSKNYAKDKYLEPYNRFKTFLVKLKRNDTTAAD
jgi:hypothetical protein